MPFFVKARSFLRNLSSTRRVEADLDQEVHSHLEMLTEENIRAGMSPKEAQRAARIELGGIEQVKEQVRQERIGNWLYSVLSDCRYGARQLRKNPSFTAIAVLTLGLGIGANTAIFSVIENSLLHPVPWKDPDRIVDLWEIDAATKEARQVVSPANFLDWRAQALQSTFDSVAAWHFTYLNVAGRDQPEQVEALAVTVDYFRLLGFQAALGRTFLPGDDQPGGAHTVVLSHAFWQRRFASDATLIGRTIELNGESCTVIGVLPSDFHIFRVLNRELDLYVPLTLDPVHLNRADNSVFVYARLKQGVSLGEAQSEIEAAYRGLAQEYPATNAGLGAKLIPLPQQWTTGVRPILLLLVTAVGIVLLIGCSNVAGLLFARGAARHREMAVRVALGAGRLRLIRQSQTESLLLALGGGAAGLGVAYASIDLLNHYRFVSSAEDFRLDVPVLTFALAIAVLTSVIFGLLPALQSSQASLAGSLSDSARSLSGSVRSRRLRDLQVVVEVALAAILLVTGSLVLQSALRLELMNRGINIKNVLTMQIWLPQKQYPDGRAVGRFYQELLARIRVLPGVQSASAANFPPLAVESAGVHFTTRPYPPSAALPPEAQWANVSVISTDYFKTMGIPLLAGRDFTEQDADEARGVVIVSEATAHRFWPGRNPIGSEVWPIFPKVQNFYDIESQNRPLAVVGVAGDLRQDGTTAPAGLPQIYVPYRQNPSAIMSLLVRTGHDPLGWASTVRSQVWSVDKDQPVWNIRTMEDVVAENFSRSSSIAGLLDVFAAVALILAAIGIYGVMSYSVGQRTHEIGIRMALGAQPRAVLGLVMREGLGLVAAGVVVGLLGALGAARLLSNLLYGISSSDPLTYAGVALLLTLVAIAACYIPARRATRVDPMVALRYE